MRLLKNIQRLTLSTIFILALSACSSKDNSDANAAAQTGGATQDTGTASGTGAGNEANLTRNVNVILPPDVTAPILTLGGESTLTLFQGSLYTEQGATATDERDGSVSVNITGNVNSAVLGIYTVTYSATYKAGNTATLTRTVNVVLPPDVTAPVITLNGDVNISLSLGEAYVELGAIAYDQRDGDVNVTISGSVDTSIEGIYSITYTARDKAGNEAAATRTVNVVEPALTSLSLESNVTTLNVGEKAELTVMATYSDGSTSELDVNVEYIITPSDSVDVNGSVLTAKKDSDVAVQAKIGTTLSNTLNLTIAWVVNGHVLPPEPDKTLNDSTLLGVDVNDNGVRDDVERWIYEAYKDKHPIHIDIAMQAGRAYRQVLETPERAKEIRESVNAPYFCGAYYQNDAKYVNGKILTHERIDTPVKSKYFNTKARSDVYWEYDKALSGDSYDIPWPDEQKSMCDFDTSKYED